MSDLIDIQSRFDKLQKQFSELRTWEFDKIGLEILVTMQAFGITNKVFLAVRVRVNKSKSTSAATWPRVKFAKSSAVSGVAPKFRSPNDEAFGGRGLTPRGTVALGTQDSRKEDFAIKV